MSNSEVLLDVSVADQSSEVIVVDSGFRVLAHGIQSVQIKVPPGIYRAKVRVGDQQSEKLFSVESNEPNNRKFIQLAPLEFSSPIPLMQTSTSHEYHQGAISNATASGETAQKTAQLGAGAAVVIFLRDPSSVYFGLAADQMESYAKNFEGFILSKLGGSESHPLETIGTLVSNQGYLIARAAVTPGTYALSRVSSGTERLCLPLVVPAGWSLQTFISLVPTDDSGIGRRADFDGAAMVFDRPGARFFPDRTDLRVLEVVRQALARGHNVIDAKAMEELLVGKFENPMMGLLAAHLLLLAKKPDLDLAQLVVNNTGNLIGTNYPDLRMLSWKLGQLRGTAASPDAIALVESTKGPPMLQLSWHYFMEAYRNLSDKKVLDKGISNMAGQLVSSSVWMSWLESTEYQSVPANVAEDMTQAEAQEELPVALGHSAPVIEPSPLINVSTASQESTASKKSMTLPCLGADGNAPPLRRHVNYVQGKVTDWFESRTGARHLKLPKLDTVHLDTALKKARVTLHRTLQNVEADTVSHIFETLVERVDWKAVVGQLKAATRLGEKPRTLTPLQRQLLLSLKTAREQLEEEGHLPEEAVRRRLNISDVPIHAILNDLDLLFLIAENLDKMPPSSHAKAIVRTQDD